MKISDYVDEIVKNIPLEVKIMLSIVLWACILLSVIFYNCDCDIDAIREDKAFVTHLANTDEKMLDDLFNGGLPQKTAVKKYYNVWKAKNEKGEMK